MNKTYKEDFTEPISLETVQPVFDLLTSYRTELAQHPLMEAARRGELPTEILLELAFYQYSDSILWIPMLAQMKEMAVRSKRLRTAIEDNIAHEAGIGGTSHVTLAVQSALARGRGSMLGLDANEMRRRADDALDRVGLADRRDATLAVQMMRSLGVRDLEAFSTSTFTKSATLWLTDEFVRQPEPEVAGWLLVAESLVPLMFAEVAPCFAAIGGDTRYFTQHVAVDSDEHAKWMTEAVADVLQIYGAETAREQVLAGMRDAWQETIEVPDHLWRRACASR